jgi:hypothetical protein
MIWKQHRAEVVIVPHEEDGTSQSKARAKRNHKRSISREGGTP